MTFEDTPNQKKVVAPNGLQILNQVELVEAVGVKLVEEIINQLVTKGQSNLGLQHFKDKM
jgi:hypothetical protein